MTRYRSSLSATCAFVEAGIPDRTDLPETSACSLAAMGSPPSTPINEGVEQLFKGVESGIGAGAVVIATAVTQASPNPVLHHFSEKVIPPRTEEHHAGDPLRGD